MSDPATTPDGELPDHIAAQMRADLEATGFIAFTEEMLDALIMASRAGLAARRAQVDEDTDEEVE